MQTPQNPLEGYVSICCGVQHDINAEHTIDNEEIVGGCCSCKRYAEFVPAEDFVRRKRGVINRLAFSGVNQSQASALASLNSFVPDDTDYHMDLW